MPVDAPVTTASDLFLVGLIIIPFAVEALIA